MMGMVSSSVLLRCSDGPFKFIIIEGVRIILNLPIRLEAAGFFLASSENAKSVSLGDVEATIETGFLSVVAVVMVVVVVVVVAGGSRVWTWLTAETNWVSQKPASDISSVDLEKFSM